MNAKVAAHKNAGHPTRAHRYSPVLATLFGALLAACSTLTPVTVPPPAAPATPAQLAAKGYLGAAISAQIGVVASHPDDDLAQQQLREWQAQAQALESHHLQQAANAWQKDQLGNALAELDIGLLTLPQNTALQRKRIYYRELLDRRLSAQKQELAQTRARYLVETLRVQQQIFRLVPAESIGSAAISTLDHEAQTLGPAIIEQAELALKQKRYASARPLYQLAAELGQKALAAQGLAQLSQREQQTRSATKASETRSDDSEAAILEARKQMLISRYQNALVGKDWLTCVQILRELQQLFPNEMQWREWQLAQTPAVHERSRQLKEDGLRRYRAGDVAAALPLWQQALQLTPESSDLPGLIERAQRVLSNLKASALESTQKPPAR